MGEDTMVLRHVFMWSVKPEFDGAQVLAELAKLPSLVPGLLSWSIGEHVGNEVHSSGSRYEYAIVCDFAGKAELDEYQNNPEHVAVVDRVLAKYQDWAVIDFWTTSAPLSL
jgi:antibiotic biosynthesis monooxygenase (ABM) superfamily enzyme